MSAWKSAIMASRPRTIPLSLSGIVSGSAVAYYLGAFDITIFIASIFVVLCLQILSNFANDLGDSEKGTDNASRIGPARSIQAGLITPQRMKTYIQALAAASLLVGSILIMISNLLWIERLILFCIGNLAIIAAYTYTKGSVSYGYRGLGDISVLLFFGIVSVMGSQFLYIHHLSSATMLPALGVGMMSTAVLHLNNMRDRVPDSQHQKITIAVRLGRENSRIYFTLLILTGTLLWISYVFTQTNTNYMSYLYWIGIIPSYFILYKFLKIKEDKAYDKLLKPTALITFLTSVLFFISQVF